MSTSPKDEIVRYDALILQDEEDLPKQKEKIESAEKAVKISRETIGDIIVAMLKSGSNNGSSWNGSLQLIFTAGLTRLGIMILSIYLVRFLVQLYQYNVRLAAHYQTQIQALLLLGESHSKIQNLSNTLSVGIDFDRPKFTDKDPLLAGYGKMVENLGQKIDGLQEQVTKQSTPAGKNKPQT